jgi:4-carboxymuconolactone decarboxylase
MMQLRPVSSEIGEGRRLVGDYQATLRKLSVRDDAYIDGLLANDDANEAASRLEGKTHALVGIAALIAVDAATPCYLEAIREARSWHASSEEIVGCLIAILPTVGIARVVSAAPKVGLALGYDVEIALEAPAPGFVP